MKWSSSAPVKNVSSKKANSGLLVLLVYILMSSLPSLSIPCVLVLCESTAAEAANDRQMAENECRRKAERKADHGRPRSDPHRWPQDPHRKHTDRYSPNHLCCNVERTAGRLLSVSSLQAINQKG